MKKMILILFVILALASLTRAQMPERRFELNIFGGYAMTSVKGLSTYSDTWQAYLFGNVTETTDISANSKGAPFFGAGFKYFFTPNLGLGLDFGYLKSGIDTIADFNFDYGSTSTASWTSTGNSLTSIPISLNLIGRFGEGPIQFFIQGGPTLYFNDAKIDSSLGYGVNWVTYSYPYTYSHLDALQIPLNGFDVKSGKTSWMGIGGNVGLGVSFMFSPSIGLNLEGRYFLNPTRDFDWELVTGTYNGIFGGATGFDFTADDAQYLFDNNLITTFKVNPSFFQVTLGLKIVL